MEGHIRGLRVRATTRRRVQPQPPAQFVSSGTLANIAMLSDGHPPGLRSPRSPAAPGAGEGKGTQVGRKTPTSSATRPPLTPGGGRSDAVKRLEAMIAGDTGAGVTRPRARDAKADDRPRDHNDQRQQGTPAGSGQRSFADTAGLSHSLDSLRDR